MSSSPLVPREKLSAYQRWELHSFDLPGDLDSPTQAGDSKANQADIAESLRRKAYEAGRADGLRDGLTKGADNGRALRDLLASASQQSHEINQNLADDLLRLALEVAREMVRRSLAIHPDSIITLIHDALAQLSNANAQLTLTLHPADATLVRTQLAESIETGKWLILESTELRRGGCLLQTATSHMDASIGTRWQHLTERLELDDTWLD